MSSTDRPLSAPTVNMPSLPHVAPSTQKLSLAGPTCVESSKQLHATMPNGEFTCPNNQAAKAQGA
jgi:hypothetical protein